MNTKIVHREVESEGRYRQNSGLTNRNHIRLYLWIRQLNKLKSNNDLEINIVKVVDIYGGKDCVLTWGGHTGRWKQSKKSTVTKNGKTPVEVIVPNGLKRMAEDGNLGYMKKMQVTDDRYKNRKIQRKIGVYLGMVSGEEKEELRAFTYQRITEAQHINTHFSDTGLLEKILERQNQNKAYKWLVLNKGVSGIDEKRVYELMPHLRANKGTLYDLNTVLTKEEIAKQGYMSMLGYYIKARVN